MAVSTTLHSAIINASDASPATLVQPGIYGGNRKVQIGRVALLASDSIASIYRMFRVKSTDTVVSIKFFTAETLTAMAADVGLYRTVKDGGAVVDVDAYASAVLFSTANVLAGAEVGFEARGVNVLGQAVWEDIVPLPVADTKLEYDIAVTVTTPTTAAGTVTMMLTYISNG